MATPKNESEKQEAVEVEAPVEGTSRRTYWWLFVMALIARGLFLGRADLWGDEVLFAQSGVPPQSVWQVFQNHWERFLVIGHLPLPAMIQNVVLWVMSWFTDDLLHQPLVQRIPAVLMGSATVPLFFAMARRLVSRQVALAATLVLAFFYFPVHYSREAYVYAPLMLFAVAGLYWFLRIVSEGRLDWKSSGLLLGSLVAASYSHLTGVLLPIAIFLWVTGVIILNKAPQEADPAAFRRVGMRIWIVCVVAVAAIAPFYYQRILNRNPREWPVPETVFAHLHELVGKVFMGISLPGEIVAWALVACGIAAILGPSPKRYLRVSFFVITLIIFFLIFLGVARTQFSPRYFYITVAPLYLVFAMGIDWAVRKLLGAYKLPEATMARAASIVLGVLLAVHAYFLIQGYQLTSKALDFGSIARWLTANMPPGSSYVFESGYDQRFVPGYFATPGLVGAVPYVHGAGTQEAMVLRERQRQFFLQFPSACYVEASRHGSEPGTDYGVWEWPHEYFKNVEDIRNRPLERLIKLGIYPPFKPTVLAEKEYLTRIWYNRPEDAMQVWAQGGRLVFFTYDQWRCTQINRNAYANAANLSWNVVRATNLTGAPLRGKLAMTGGLTGAERGYDITVKLAGKTVYEGRKWPGQLWSIETDELEIPAGTHNLEWGVAGEPDPDVQALLVVSLGFIRSSDEAVSAPVAEPEPAEEAEPAPSRGPVITFNPDGPAAPEAPAPAPVVADKPAEPVVAEPPEPVVDEPPEPVVDEPAEPVVDESAEPVVDEPASPAPEADLPAGPDKGETTDE